MLFSARRVGSGFPLQPFVLRLRDGYLVGLGLESDKGSPCIRCSELWLKQRRVWTERIRVEDLKIRRDVLESIREENSAHVFYEISADGSSTRMDCLVFPHPECGCNKQNYLPPSKLTQRTNFAFSPVYQIKCARYGTPSGNLWLTCATGAAPGMQTNARVFATAKDREPSRLQAMDEWMKQAAYHDLSQKLLMGQTILGENLRTQNHEALFQAPDAQLLADGLGIGANYDEAVINGLVSLAKTRTLRKHAGLAKNPMLIVGTNNWVRTRVPFFLLQQYDLHLMFYPNSTPTWVVGVCALSRLRTDEKPVFTFGSHADILQALDCALGKMLERCRPTDWEESESPEAEKTEEKRTSLRRLGTWWNNWVYRCPKIPLRDVLHLESYSNTVESWRDYFNDGQETLNIIRLNTPLLPEKLRTIVKIQSSSVLSPLRNVKGIGTWASLGTDAV